MKTFAIAMISAVSSVAAQDLWDGVDTQEITWADLRSMLGSNEAVVNASEEIAQALRAQAAIHVGEMPEVCEGGLACRTEHLETARLSVATEWQTTLTSIAREIENTIISGKHIFQLAWEEAKECEADCPCDDILKEYREILNYQDEISKEITELEVSLSLLKDEHYNILGSCPEYEVITLASIRCTKENLLVNGSFNNADDDLLMMNYSGKWSEPLAPVGWTVTKGQGVEITNGEMTQHGYAPNPRDPTGNYVELDGLDSSGIAQWVEVEEGQEYYLSYDFGTRNAHGGDNDMETYWEGTLIETLNYQANGGVEWSQHEHIVVAGNPEKLGDLSGKLEFRSIGDNDRGGEMLDEVVLMVAC